jgi:hypothetical protein
MLKPSLMLLFLLSLNTVSASVIDYRADISGWFSGETCGGVNRAELSALKENRLCPEKDVSVMYRLNKDVNAALEKSLFSEAAADQVAILDCDLKELNLASSPTPAGQKFRGRIIQDIAIKLPEFKKLYDKMMYHKGEMEEAHKKVASIYSSVNRSLLQLGSPSVQRQLKDYNNEAKVHQKLMLDHSRPFSALMMTVWNGDSEFMSDFIINVIKSNKTPEVFAKQAAKPFSNSSWLWPAYSLQDSMVRPMKNRLKADRDSLVAQSANGKGAKPFNTNFATRSMLVKYGDLMLKLSADPKDRLTGLACRLQARYVKGDHNIKMGIYGGALLLTGVAGRLASLATASRLSVYLEASEAAAVMKYSRVLTIIGKVAENATVVERIQRMCLGGQPNHIHRSCQNTNYDVALGRSLYLENCAFAVAMAFDPAWIKMSKSAPAAFRNYMYKRK